MARFLGAGPRRVLLVGGSVLAAAVGVAGLVVWANTRVPEQPASEARRMPPVDPRPGGPNNTAALDELRRRDEADKAAQAQRNGASHAVAMGGFDAFDPRNVARPPNRVEFDAPRPSPRFQKSPADLKEVAAYDEAMRKLLRAWDGEGTADRMFGQEDNDIRQASAGQRSGTARQASAEGQRQQPQRRKRVLFPANAGVYGTVKIGASSDEPNAPIVVELHNPGGPLDGLRAIGGYTRTQARNGDVLAGSMVKVTRLTLADGRNVPVDAVLVGVDDMGTAVATRIDPHTAERIVYPMAAAFAQGLGRALALSGSFVAAGPFGYSQGFREFDAGRLLGIGAGAAGQAAGQILREQAPRQSTRYVDAGSEAGVYFLAPVEVED